MEDIIKLFRESLLSTSREWVEKNHDVIGDKWCDYLLKQLREVDADTAIGIMATGLWMFSMMPQFGVSAGMGPDGAKIQELNPRLDEPSTKRLLMMIASCMNLQYLPKEIATKPIPIINTKRFSLKLFTEQ